LHAHGHYKLEPQLIYDSGADTEQTFLNKQAVYALRTYLHISSSIQAFHVAIKHVPSPNPLRVQRVTTNVLAAVPLRRTFLAITKQTGACDAPLHGQHFIRGFPVATKHVPSPNPLRVQRVTTNMLAAVPLRRTFLAITKQTGACDAPLHGLVRSMVFLF
jgi:N-glycosylase/DNA lyase